MREIKLCQSEISQGDNSSSQGDGINTAKLSTCNSSTNKFKSFLLTTKKITFGFLKKQLPSFLDKIVAEYLGQTIWPHEPPVSFSEEWRQWTWVLSDSYEVLNMPSVLWAICQKASRSPWHLVAPVNICCIWILSIWETLQRCGIPSSPTKQVRKAT